MPACTDCSDRLEKFFMYSSPIRDLFADKCRRKYYLPWWPALLTKYDNVVEILVGLGVDPNEKCPSYLSIPGDHVGGHTFLELAALMGDFLDSNYYEVGQALIKLGANVDALVESCDNKSLVQVAIQRGMNLCVKLLLENGAKLDQGFVFQGSRFTPGPGFLVLTLSMTSKSGEIDTICTILGLLFKHGADPRQCDPMGSNLLHCLIYTYTLKVENLKYDITDIAKTLVEAGVPINGTNNDRLTPLHLAIHRNDPKLAAYLIKKGADISMRTGRNFLPVEEAVRYGSQGILELLLDQGIHNINARYSDGSSLLHLACVENKSHIISFLLKKGVNISPRNNSNLTPFALLNLNDSQQKDSVTSMIKEFSKLTVNICDSDWALISKHQRTLKIFKNCKKELLKMSDTKFYASHSYLLILKMSKGLNKLVNMAKNDGFEKKFLAGLTQFDYYKEDLELIFKRALKIRNNSLAVQSRLKTVFDNFLPEAVLRSLAAHLRIKDLPLDSA